MPLELVHDEADLDPGCIIISSTSSESERTRPKNIDQKPKKNPFLDESQAVDDQELAAFELLPISGDEMIQVEVPAVQIKESPSSLAKEQEDVSTISGSTQFENDMFASKLSKTKKVRKENRGRKKAGLSSDVFSSSMPNDHLKTEVGSDYDGDLSGQKKGSKTQEKRSQKPKKKDKDDTQKRVNPYEEFINEHNSGKSTSITTTGVRIELYTSDKTWTSASNKTKNALFTFIDYVRDGLEQKFREWTTLRSSLLECNLTPSTNKKGRTSNQPIFEIHSPCEAIL